MRVQRIQIKNVLGIEDLEIEPGQLTVVSGKNGTGKTSTMEAIQSVLGGGHDATLIRNGADAGEVVLVLDNGVEVTKRITPSGSKWSARHPELGEVSKPATYVQKLVDTLSMNPVAFLAAPAKKRAEYLLEALPLEIDPTELRVAVDGALEISDAELAGHALSVIERVRTRLYDERTGVNRAAKEKRATIEQLGASLPEGAQDAAALEERAFALEADKERITAAYHTRSAAIRQTRDALIADLQRQIDEAKALAERSLEALRDELRPEGERINAELATVQQQAKEALRHANTRAVLDRMGADVESLSARSQEITASMTRLDALKLSLLERLPIAGVEIREGEVYHDGVPFDRLNRAKQVEIALAVAKLRAGDLGLICVDGLECMDSETFAAFQKWSAQGDLQLIVTRVSDGEFAVTTPEAA